MIKVMTKKMFVDRLRKLRSDKNLTQTFVAKKAGISLKLYEFYESATNTRVPTYKNLIKFANFFGCSIDYLLCQTDNPMRSI